MIEQYIQLLKTNPAALIWAQAVALFIIVAIVIAQIVVMMVMTHHLKRQSKKIDRTIERTRQYLDVVMESEDNGEVNSAEANSREVALSQNQFQMDKQRIHEEQNNIIASVLDEVFE